MPSGGARGELSGAMEDLMCSEMVASLRSWRQNGAKPYWDPQLKLLPICAKDSGLHVTGPVSAYVLGENCTSIVDIYQPHLSE